jgi:hypothetical protein
VLFRFGVLFGELEWVRFSGLVHFLVSWSGCTFLVWLHFRFRKASQRRSRGCTYLGWEASPGDLEMVQFYGVGGSLGTEVGALPGLRRLLGKLGALLTCEGTPADLRWVHFLLARAPPGGAAVFPL